MDVKEKATSNEKPVRFYDRKYKWYLVVMTALVLIAAVILAVQYLSVYGMLDRQISG